MHQSRRTHNAHNETQRRLKKLSKKERGITYPHYNIVHYDEAGKFKYIEPNWNYYGSCLVSIKNHFGGKHVKTIEESNYAKKHSFYTRFSKSESSYWRWAKRRLHKIWRRKSPNELTYTYKDAIGCSLYDLW